MDFAAVLDPAYLPLLWQGFLMTMQLLVISLLIGFLIAVPMAIAAVSPHGWVKALPRAFIYCFRGTPLLIQLYLIYYGLGQFEAVRDSAAWAVLRDPWWCAVIAFSLNTAAYTAEILRGTMLQTPWGEIEAGKAAGMSEGLLLRRIIFPNTLRRALPAYGNEAIFMLHGTALASLVTLLDLLGAGKIINSKTFASFESYITVGAIYLALTFTIVFIFRQLERVG
ncbi:ABC transporter permease, partial [Gammaproteobacteria bacterium]|nr:ABC transporter permease [Gammaproteobacteria bacterium]